MYLARRPQTRRFPLPGRRGARAWGWLLALALLGATAAGAATTIDCPVRVATRNASLHDGSEHEGFEARFNDQSMAYLLEIGISDGPVAIDNVVAPVLTKPHPQWDLSGLKRTPYLVCHYEGGILLGRSLGPGLKACVADLRRIDMRLSSGVGFERAALHCQ